MTTFADFLAGLPAIKLDRLYSSTWTCQAVLRSLPPLAKQYVLRMLFLADPLPEHMMAEWCVADGQSKHQAAMSRLEQLRVLLPSSEGDSTSTSNSRALRLNPTLQKQLKSAIVSGNVATEAGALTPASSRRVAESELDDHSRSRWEAVLLHLTGPGSGAAGAGVGSAGPPPKRLKENALVRSIFRRAGLLEPSEAEKQQQIKKGVWDDTTGRFGFLLKDSTEQLWVVISNYIAVCEEERGMDAAELLMFLLELGFCTPGLRYSLAALSPQRLSVVEDLEVLGLVQLQEGTKGRYFVPTRLASTLSASLSQSTVLATGKGFAIVETNFKVYAHTGSLFLAELLGLFMRIDCRLPNLIIGEISRETAMRAFDSGITADQIVQYLRKHAHPHVAARVPIVPETVVDQIRLWEFDRNRIGLVSSVLYEDFPSQEAFEATVAHARENGFLLWHDSKRRKIVVDASSHDVMKEWFKKLSQRR